MIRIVNNDGNRVNFWDEKGQYHTAIKTGSSQVIDITSGADNRPIHVLPQSNPTNQTHYWDADGKWHTVQNLGNGMYQEMWRP